MSKLRNVQFYRNGALVETREDAINGMKAQLGSLKDGELIIGRYKEEITEGETTTVTNRSVLGIAYVAESGSHLEIIPDDDLSDVIAKLDVDTIQAVESNTTDNVITLTLKGVKEVDGKIEQGDGTATVTFAKVAKTGESEDVAKTSNSSAVYDTTAEEISSTWISVVNANVLADGDTVDADLNKLDTKIAGLADELIADEKVINNTFASVKTSVGLDDNFAVSFTGNYTNGKTVVKEAIDAVDAQVKKNADAIDAMDLDESTIVELNTAKTAVTAKTIKEENGKVTVQNAATVFEFNTAYDASSNKAATMTDITNKINELDADFTGDSAVKGTNVTVGVKEENGKITDVTVAEDYATVSYTEKTETSAPTLTVTTGDESKLVKASDLVNAKNYTDGKVAYEIEQLDAVVDADQTATETGKVVPTLETPTTDFKVLNAVTEENGKLTAATAYQLKKVAATGKAEDVSYDDSTSQMGTTENPVENTQKAIEVLDSRVDSLTTDSKVALYKTSDGSAATTVTADGTEYALQQGGTSYDASKVVAKFNIVKESFVKEGKTVQIVKATDDKFYDINECTYNAETGTYTPNEGATVITDTVVTTAGAGWYIKLVVKTSDGSETTQTIWIPAEAMVDHYTADNEGHNVTVTVNNTNNTISADITTTNSAPQLNMDGAEHTVATVAGTSISVKTDSLAAVAANTVGGVQLNENSNALSGTVVDGAITTAKIVDDAVTEDKLSDAINTKIANAYVSSEWGSGDNAGKIVFTDNAGNTDTIKAVESVKATGDSYITVAPTTDTSGKVELTVNHNTQSGLTAGSYGEASTATKTQGSTVAIPRITVDAAGHITAASDSTITLPSVENGGTTVSANTETGVIDVTDTIKIDGTDKTNTFSVTSANTGVALSAEGTTITMTHETVTGVNQTASDTTSLVFADDSLTKTVVIPSLTVNTNGHVTAETNTTYTITLPASIATAVQTVTGETNEAEMTTGEYVNVKATKTGTDVALESKVKTVTLSDANCVHDEYYYRTAAGDHDFSRITVAEYNELTDDEKSAYTHVDAVTAENVNDGLATAYDAKSYVDSHETIVKAGENTTVTISSDGNHTVYTVNATGTPVEGGDGITATTANNTTTVAVDLAEYSTVGETTTNSTEAKNLLIIDDDKKLSISDTWDCGTF